MNQKILIWDVPTRVFHWLLVGSFAGAYYTADSERYRDIHVMLGYILLGLIVFRILWGFVGTRYARFGSFFFRPGETVAYVKSLVHQRAQHYWGHNPAGSVAILLLISLGAVSGITGVMALRDVGGDMVVEWHDLVSETMLAIVLVHILGVITSSILHRENLVRSMITGYKTGTPDQEISKSYSWLGIVLILVTVVFWFAYPVKG